MATPIGAATAAPITAAIDTREFAVTSATPFGSSRRYCRGAGDSKRLRGDQAAERRRVKPDILGEDGAGHDPAQEPTHSGRRPDRPASAVPEPVQEWPDHRCDHHERRHRQNQVQRDPRPGLRGRDGEEQRVSERDRHQHVRRSVDGIEFDQSGQPGRAGALGARRTAQPGGAGPSRSRGRRRRVTRGPR